MESVVPTPFELEAAHRALRVPESLSARLTAFGDAVQTVAGKYDPDHRVPARVILAAVSVAAARLGGKDDLTEIKVTYARLPRSTHSAWSGKISLRMVRVPVPDERAGSFFFVRAEGHDARLYCVVLSELVKLVAIFEPPTDLEEQQQWWLLPDEAAPPSSPTGEQPSIRWSERNIGHVQRRTHEQTVRAAIAALQARREIGAARPGDIFAGIELLIPLASDGEDRYTLAMRGTAGIPSLIIETSYHKGSDDWFVSRLAVPVDAGKHGATELTAAPASAAIPALLDQLAKKRVVTVGDLVMRPPGAYRDDVRGIGKMTTYTLQEWLKDEFGIDWPEQ